MNCLFLCQFCSTSFILSRITFSNALLAYENRKIYICWQIFIPFHSFVLFQATRPIQTIRTLNKKTENQYRENDKNRENTKHTVKQSRKKINVHAHLHNLERLYQSITRLLALQRAAWHFLSIA